MSPPGLLSVTNPSVLKISQNSSSMWCCAAPRTQSSQPATKMAELIDNPTHNVDDTVQKERERIVLQQHVVHVLDGGDDRLSWAVADTRGRRADMQDAFLVRLDLEATGGPKRTSIFALFDGHGGKEVAAYCAQHMPVEVLRAPAFSDNDLGTALQQAFLSLDSRLRDPSQQAELFALRADVPVPVPPSPAEAVLESMAAEPAGPGDVLAEARGQEVRAALPEPVKERSSGYGLFNTAGQYVGPKSGSTAVVTLIRPGELVVCYVGDSRCVLSKGGKAIRLTHDHKPTLPEELERITAAGEVVGSKRPGGVPRMGGRLAMSRAIGDFEFKDTPELPPEQQAVTASPDLCVVKLTQECELMVIACDGVWDVMLPNHVVSQVHKHLADGCTLGGAARRIVRECLDSNTGLGASTDNITLMLVVFGDAVKA